MTDLEYSQLMRQLTRKGLERANRLQLVRAAILQINARYPYTDERPKGKGDGPLVSCGQHGDHNELFYIYQTYLDQHVESGALVAKDAVDALSSACMELSNPRGRAEFYKHLANRLGVNVGDEVPQRWQE